MVLVELPPGLAVALMTSIRWTIWFASRADDAQSSGGPDRDYGAFAPFPQLTGRIVAAPEYDGGVETGEWGWIGAN